MSGLLRCRRCGRKLLVAYTGREREVPRYVCRRGYLDNGVAKCISFGGTQADAAVGEEALRVLEPAGLAAAERAFNEERQRRGEATAAFRRELEQARYEADRARRQYDAADPENRLVASELEARWDAALSRVKRLEEKLRESETSVDNSGFRLEDFTRLADEVAEVWNSPGTDVRLKKRILRTLIEEIVVDTDSGTGELQLLIHWRGGTHTERRIKRRTRGQNRSHTPTEVVSAIRELALVCPDSQIALYLSRNGLMTGRGMRWTTQRVA